MSDTCKILVIDDDADFVDSTRALLESNGYTVRTAASGNAGYAQALAEKPDLIILDVMMETSMAGIELARKFKSSAALSKIPILLLTGVSKAMSLPFALETDTQWLPVSEIIEKPVPPEALLHRIKALVNR